MLNIRFRKQTNAWPGFVDLFSNLVIILIFLLIVFVFLWTTTNVFNKGATAKEMANLRQLNAEQAASIEQMAADHKTATSLLVRARDELINLESSNKKLNTEISDINLSVNDLVTAYEAKIADLQSQADALAAELAERQAAQSDVVVQSVEVNEELEKTTAELNATKAELEKLRNALAVAEEQSAAKDAEYTAMSNRLNKALADKVAELNEVAQYQSDFYKQVKIALGDRTTLRPDGDRFIISSDILFKSGSYKLSADGKKQLRLIANVIKDFEEKIPSDVDWLIRVDGHTDKVGVIPGTHAYQNNIQLSFLRATAVANELERNGVSRRRLLPSGFGDTHPFALGNTAEDMQQNRRIELKLTNK
ncbi:MAG: OmpA family protein [Proteobacteria bacterium]|nr:OmpA family protein [Candidatus Enterousia scatequi]